ncbi:VOC family protein [Niabella sp. CJ426]|uniref:VOC family protein n=1 Tax=Niabella sp. CJ426 TaxID=3393740 RepID=UPI003D06499A
MEMQHWKRTFYPEGLKDKDELNYYAQHFNTVEINSSYYHLPAATFEGWNLKSPASFTFVVKIRRNTTHLKKLEIEQDSIDLFLLRVAHLKNKEGRYTEGMNPDKTGSITFADFKLEDTWLAAVDSAHQHDFEFNESVSLMINCEDQAEIDYYWSQLSAIPESEQCGWLKDKFGLSWQVTSAEMEALMKAGSSEQVDRITRAFLKMKKIDIAAIKVAAAG